MKQRIVMEALLLALAVSAGLNVVLYRLAVTYYREGEAVRLDPGGEGLFAPDRATLTEPGPGEVRVVLLGDSRIEQWQPLPQVPGCRLVNRGIGGQTTAQVLLRLEPDALQLRPGVVLLQAGINDLKAIGVLPHAERAIVDGCTRNLTAMVRRLRGQGVHVVLLTVFPVGPIDLARRPLWSDATLTAVGEVNEALRGLAGLGVTVLDCDPVLAVGGRMNPDYARDAFHLLPAGYRALNDTLEPVLASAVRQAREEVDRGGPRPVGP